MKLVWSPDVALKAYIDTVQSCELHQESSAAELISAMAAGWNSKVIVETWSQGGAISTSIGLAIASSYTGGRHICIVSDERSRSLYAEAMAEARMSPEIVAGKVDEVMERVVEIDFLVVDSIWKDFSKVSRQARLGKHGAVVVCKNTNARVSGFRWPSVVGKGSGRIVRSVFLPVENGIYVAHIGTKEGNSGLRRAEKRWITHVDSRSGEEHVIQKYF